MTSLQNAFEPSSCAAAAPGPNTTMPCCASRSDNPATSGISGPTTTRSQPCAAATSPSRSVTATSTSRASRAMPGLPGAHSSSGRCGERVSARTIACSRPPEPTTRTRGKLQGGDEVVDGNRRERLVAAGAARAQLERDAGDRRLVRSLDDVDEVKAAQRRPLRLDGGAQLLDLLVDLADALRVVLNRLHALGSEGREHDVSGHASVSTSRRVVRRCTVQRTIRGGTRMSTRSNAIAAALALAAALPAAASAAQIQVDRNCYQDNSGTVAVSGNGFTPSQDYQVTIDSKPLPNGTGTTDAPGGLAGSFPTPELSGNGVNVYTLGIVQGANPPTTT